MSQRGSVLILALWVLTILVILAVGVGFQMSLEAKVAGTHRDRLRALSLARSALSRAIWTLEQDDPAVDSLDEPWATGIGKEGEPLFEAVPLDESSGGSWSIFYEKEDPEGSEGEQELVYAFLDEDRKINLNRASRKQLKNITSALKEMDSEMVDKILAWRGDLKDKDLIQATWYLVGKPKNAPFEQLEELHLFEGMTEALFEELEGIVTVYGPTEGESFDVNINTTDSQILQYLGLRETLAGEWIVLRDENPITDITEAILTLQDRLGLDPRGEEVAELKAVATHLGVGSRWFKIQAQGTIGQGRVQRNIEVVFEMKPAGEETRTLEQLLLYREH